jgi:pre-mRNA-splicing factor CWC22
LLFPLFAGRAGGAYIPPFRLARMMAEIDDKNSAAAQKLSWEALRKSLNGLINKVRCFVVQYDRVC